MNPQQSPDSIRCISFSGAKFSCLNQNCQKYAFICQSQACECHQEHEKCLMVKLAAITKSLKAKVMPTKELEDIIEKGLDRLIGKVQNFKKQIIGDIKQRFQLFGLSDSEREILLQLQTGVNQNISGSKMWEIHVGLQKENQNLLSIQYTQERIDSTIQQLQNQIDKSLQQTKNLIQHLEQSNKSQPQIIQKTIKSPKFQLKPKNYLSTPIQPISSIPSKIVNNPEQMTILSSFFIPKLIKSLKLLYRASQHAFGIDGFHEKCDNIPNTLIVCETQFNKKIGGFTPIPWNSSGSYKKDETGESFLFSLTNKDKFFLQDKDNAVYHHNNYNYGPVFGSGCDFVLYEKSNLNSFSYCKINTSYINKKYKNGDKGSWQRFHGDFQGTYHFKTKEWEVWRVQFFE